ncbi:hypothetical protein DPMN_129357 [Dreissena polymorpha]|uniref:Uncharacterized protein n=1 Tax=Dreissena polymorpha TaxID=45954 RepID=A0A9D4JWK3_DREPO|nr:hypothetical protein DPMN_129357 [Dreissena polymorpha]
MSQSHFNHHSPRCQREPAAKLYARMVTPQSAFCKKIMVDLMVEFRNEQAAHCG